MCFLVTMAAATLAAIPPTSADGGYETSVGSAAPTTLRLRAGPMTFAVKSATHVHLVLGATLGSVDVIATSHAAGENDCAAADDAEAGVVNRTIAATLASDASATVYAAIVSRTKATTGEPIDQILEPFGPPPGTTLPLPEESRSIDISICLTD
jgi:hypothetical protein